MGKKTGRRNFLKNAAGVAALATGPSPVIAQQSTAREPEMTTDRPGSDFMLTVLKQIGFEYVCANPGSSFRALHESVVNYGGNKSPEFVTCCHEESSVAMAHGYAKIEGKPACVFAHGTVGLQHAAMAVYNAFCDRVPVYMVVGNTMDATARRPGAEFAIVRSHVEDGSRPGRRCAQVDLVQRHRASPVSYPLQLRPDAVPAFDDLVDDPEYARYREHPLTTPTPGGETIGQVQERGVKAIRRTVEAHPGKRILFVSHGDIIRTVLCHFIGAELEHFRRIRIDNATFSAIQLIGDFAEVKFMNLLPDPERAFQPPFRIKPRKSN